jgi:ATP-binding cassette subfamily B protein
LSTQSRPSRSRALRDLFAPILAQRVILVAITLLSLASSVIALSQPLVVASLIDRVSHAGDLGPLPWLLAGLLALGGVVGGTNQYLIQRTAESSIRSTRRDLVGHILSLPIPEFDNQRSADLVSRVSNDTTVVRNMLSQGLVEAVAGLITLAGAAVAMFLIDPMMLGVAALVAVGSVFAVVMVTTRLEGASLGLQTSVGRLSAALDRAIRSVRTLRAANATGFEIERVVGEVDETWRVGLRVARITGLIAPISSVAMQGAFLAVLGLGGLRVAEGRISVAQLVSFILYLFLMIMPLGQLFGTMSAISEALGGVARIHEIQSLAIEDGIAAPSVRERDAGSPIGVEFRGVSFRYPATEGEESTLSDVSFTVRPGQRVAIVGPSGAGKTTLLRLLARFYDPLGGSILIGGEPTTEQPRWATRDAIAYVEQDAPALAGTIRDNLTLGETGFGDELLLDALAEVNLRPVVERSRLGLDAEIGEAGVLLSGGERQRLAVARALLRRPRLLLLDESTSNLDGLNEQTVYRSVARAASDCTLLVVAHRLSTVRDCDLILVLADGVVAASGSHQQLLEESVLYRQLAHTQFGSPERSAVAESVAAAGHDVEAGIPA